MRSVRVALFLLLVYLFLVFASFRILDILSLTDGANALKIVDPNTLSIASLKQLIQIRGLVWNGDDHQRQEVVSLVRKSGNVVKGELEELKSNNGQFSYTRYSSYFTGADHFYEEVEDTKDSVWLVQVIPPGVKEGMLLSDTVWTEVKSWVAPLSIRTGIFNCELDHRLCVSKGWTEPLLLLALPRGNKPKDKVVLTTCQYTNPTSIISWLREELNERVKKIDTYEELGSDWLTVGKSNNSLTSGLGVRVILFTQSFYPPLFFAALSIKFTGRIAFGIFNVKNEDMDESDIPAYVVVTPDRKMVYGKRKYEYLNFKSMDAFLSALQPEINDVFLFSLTLVNMFCLLLMMAYQDSWWKVLMGSIWTAVVCNLILFAIWLGLLGSLGWPIFDNFGDWGITLMRKVALSEVGSLMRSDWNRLCNASGVLLTSLISFGILSGWTLNLREELGQHTDSWWWPFECLFRPQPTGSIDLEDELNILIDRIATPSFWLQPYLRLCYENNLTVWNYKSKKRVKKDSPEMIETIMDSSDDSLMPSVNNSDSDSILTESETEDFIIKTTDCAICLDNYHYGVTLCALPCGHNFHQLCIVTWLQRANLCPVCRWPAYKSRTRPT